LNKERYHDQHPEQVSFNYNDSSQSKIDSLSINKYYPNSESNSKSNLSKQRTRNDYQETEKYISNDESIEQIIADSKNYENTIEPPDQKLIDIQSFIQKTFKI